MTEILNQVEAKDGGHDDVSQHSRNLLLNEAHGYIRHRADTDTSIKLPSSFLGYHSHDIPNLTIDGMAQNQSSNPGHKPGDVSGTASNPATHDSPKMTSDGPSQSESHKPHDVSGTGSNSTTHDSPKMTGDGPSQGESRKPHDVSGIPAQHPKDTGVWGTGYDGKPGSCPPGATC